MNTALINDCASARAARWIRTVHGLSPQEASASALKMSEYRHRNYPCYSDAPIPYDRDERRFTKLVRRVCGQNLTQP
jgi:hypothetical protein